MKVCLEKAEGRYLSSSAPDSSAKRSQDRARRSEGAAQAAISLLLFPFKDRKCTIKLMQSKEPETQEEQTEDPQATSETTSWQYNAEDSAASTEQPHPTYDTVTWTASEFVEHEKAASWFIILFAGGAGVVTLIYLITKEKTTAAVISMAVILFAVAAQRKPRTLTYEINSSGVTIGPKTYPYAQFKSFAVVEEGAFNSIQLMPLKRFMPPISLYCPPEQEQQVIEALGNYLPHEERRHDPIDRLMRKVRF